MSKKSISDHRSVKRPKVSAQLRQAINDCPLSRYRISKLTGISEATLSRFTNGKSGLSLRAVDRLGAVLDLEVIAHGPKP